MPAALKSKSPRSKPAQSLFGDSRGQLHLAIGAILVATIAFVTASISRNSTESSAAVRPDAPSGSHLVPTQSNAPRTDDGGAGSDARCRTGTDGLGAVPLPLVVTGPGTGGPSPAKADGPFTQDPTPHPVKDNPAIPTAPGSTVRPDGSVVYHMQLLEPPAIRNGGIGMGLTYRTWTDAAYHEGSATEGFDDSLHGASGFRVGD